MKEERRDKNRKAGPCEKEEGTSGGVGKERGEKTREDEERGSRSSVWGLQRPVRSGCDPVASRGN